MFPSLKVPSIWSGWPEFGEALEERDPDEPWPTSGSFGTLGGKAFRELRHGRPAAFAATSLAKEPGGLLPLLPHAPAMLSSTASPWRRAKASPTELDLELEVPLPRWLQREIQRATKAARQKPVSTTAEGVTLSPNTSDTCLGKQPSAKNSPRAGRPPQRPKELQVKTEALHSKGAEFKGSFVTAASRQGEEELQQTRLWAPIAEEKKMEDLEPGQLFAQTLKKRLAQRRRKQAGAQMEAEPNALQKEMSVTLVHEVRRSIRVLPNIDAEGPRFDSQGRKNSKDVSLGAASLSGKKSLENGPAGRLSLTGGVPRGAGKAARAKPRQKGLLWNIRRKSCKTSRLDKLESLRKRKEQEGGFLPLLLGSAKSDISAKTGDPQVDSVIEAFERYDGEGDGGKGFLRMSEIRAALLDLGLQPTTSEEKAAASKAILDAISECRTECELAQVELAGLNLETFLKLVPKLREVRSDLKRAGLQEWYSRIFDESGHLDYDQLKQCMEVLGSTPPTETVWNEIQEMFHHLDANWTKWGQGTKSKRPTSANSRFEQFEQTFHAAQEKLTAARRDEEREIAQERGLQDKELEEFRSDLIELNGLFDMFDVDQSGTLEEQEIMELLVACGAISGWGRLGMEVLRSMIADAKRRARDYYFGQREPSRRSSVDGGRTPPSPRKTLSRASDMRLDRVGTTGSLGNLHLDFAQFLFLMREVREIDRKARESALKEMFQAYDYDGSGKVKMHSLSRLLQHMGMQPRSRQEQGEIRLILDEADENGDGVFEFDEFVVLVQRIHERLERLCRAEEERYGVDELGMSRERTRQVRQVFKDQLADGYQALTIMELRPALDLILPKRCSSEELHELFLSFWREDLHGVDCKGLLKMMASLDSGDWYKRPKSSGRQTARVAAILGTRGALVHVRQEWLDAGRANWKRAQR